MFEKLINNIALYWNYTFTKFRSLCLREKVISLKSVCEYEINYILALHFELLHKFFIKYA